jgi:Ca2+-binding EF-hand superfamily protein
MTEAVVKAFQISKEELLAYREAFEEYDTDGNKKLNRAELLAFLKDMNLTPELVDLAFVVFNKDKSGLMNFEEFVECVMFRAASTDDFGLYTRRVFQAFDVDKSGKLDSQELRTFLQVLQVDLIDEWHRGILSETGGQPVSVEKIIEVFSRPHYKKA